MRCAFYGDIKAFVYAAVTVFAACLVSCTDAYSGKNMPEGEYSEAALLKALEEDSTDTDALSKLYGIYTREGRFHDLIQSAGRCYRIAMEERDTALMVVSGVYLGQAYILTDKPDSMVFYFNKVLPAAERYKERFR